MVVGGTGDERTLLLGTLAFLRHAVVRKADGLDEERAAWTPEGGLLPLKGIIYHLAHVEWRWIAGALHGGEVSRDEGEFQADGVSLSDAVALYRLRATATDEAVMAAQSLDQRGAGPWGEQRDLRWILVHLIQETARHAGHADATRELLDGTKG